MHRHKFLRHAAAVLAAAALLVAVVLAGLAAALPDTLYTDGPAAELEIASMPYLTVKSGRGVWPRTARRLIQAPTSR